MRRPKGSVGIESRQGWLRLRLPTSVATGASRYITLGLQDTCDNRRVAQVKAWELEEQIRVGKVDLSKPVANCEYSLVNLWQSYGKFKKSLLAPTTYKEYFEYRYPVIWSHLPTHDIRQATTIRQWLLSHYSVATARKTLVQLSACCKWAMGQGLTDMNPFATMASPLTTKGDRQIDPFNLSERNYIIDVFQGHHYECLIKFLFYTGCRPGEACSLRWSDYALGVITFSCSHSDRYRVTKGTKNGKVRKFPCNSLVSQLMEEIPRVSSLVFLSTLGTQVSQDSLSAVWTTKVKRLVDQGKVRRYRSLYNTRHTFITLALANGLTVPQVANLVGNSPEVILRHYAGNEVLEVPVF